MDLPVFAFIMCVNQYIEQSSTDEEENADAGCPNPGHQEIVRTVQWHQMYWITSNDMSRWILVQWLACLLHSMSWDRILRGAHISIMKPESFHIRYSSGFCRLGSQNNENRAAEYPPRRQAWEWKCQIDTSKVFFIQGIQPHFETTKPLHQTRKNRIPISLEIIVNPDTLPSCLAGHNDNDTF